ncbi:MAG: quinolinate synthase NadA [Acidobacteria bacterium]|nr:MAG: quinolinate synthase NadA [Acidobacteriota bacterium]
MPIVEPTVARTYDRLKERLAHLVPEPELRLKAELVFEINRLKRERRAVILGHNYMEPALYHGVADMVGDSLELSRLAARSPAERIVFCGVRFMAETAKILSPDKTVLLPDLEAGCSLADGITAEDVRELRARFPGLPVVAYINTSAEVKAESDICCTSSNAARIVESLEAPAVIFLPDEFLAANTARETGRRIVFPVRDETKARALPRPLEPAIVGWRGRCEVHEKFTVEDIERVRAQYPDVEVLAHPECRPEVVAAADFSGSTSAMIAHVRKSSAPRFLLLTECSMGDNIVAEAPGKEMLRLCSVRCPHMNRITLEQTLASLREDRYRIEVPEQVAARARRALEGMLRGGPAVRRPAEQAV